MNDVEFKEYVNNEVIKYCGKEYFEKAKKFSDAKHFYGTH